MLSANPYSETYQRLRKNWGGVNLQIQEIDNTLPGQQELPFNTENMSTALTDNMQVRDLIKKFDLEIPEQYRMVAMEWEVVNGVVSITKVHVYNQDGEFVKEADINLLQKNMNKYTFVFHGTK